MEAVKAGCTTEMGTRSWWELLALEFKIKVMGVYAQLCSS
jgi:hypothetical protein